MSGGQQTERWYVLSIDLDDVGRRGDDASEDWAARARQDPRSAIWNSDEPLRVIMTPRHEMQPVFVSWAKVLQRQPRTAISYTNDVKQFFNYLRDHGRDWTEVDSEDIDDYLEWRRYYAPVTRGEVRRTGVSADTVVRNRSALASFYAHAVRVKVIAGSPVLPGQGQAPNFAKGQKAADANWVTRRAYNRWRTEALGGQGSKRVDSLIMVGRNQAYADLLYGTGMRRLEGAGLLTVEIPDRPVVGSLYKGRVPASLSKGRVGRGRLFYMSERVNRTLHQYVAQDRAVEEAFGIRSGRYESDRRALIARKVHKRAGIAHEITYQDTRSGAVHRTRLDDLSATQRAHLYAVDSDGQRRPLWLWLGHGGTAFRDASWGDVFADASRRMEGASRVVDAASLVEVTNAIYVHPHMLRHSFALHAFALASMIELTRTGDASMAGLRRLIAENNIWTRVQGLLGHVSVQTTRDHYLEPIQAIEWEWFTSVQTQAPDRLDEALSLIADGDERVIDIPQEVHT